MSSSRRVEKCKKTQAVETGPISPRQGGWLNFKDALSVDQDRPGAHPILQGKPITSSMLAALTATSKENYALFRPILCERMFEKLQYAIAFGDENLAMRILAGNIAKRPSLLLEEVTFKEPSGHILKGTVYQWALKCHDVDMCKMMDEHFKTLPNWQEERKKQIKAVFPNGVKACFEAQKPYDFTTLINIITNSSDADVQSALRHEYSMSTLDLRLDEFRYKFAEKSQQEDVFNPQHILKALTIYNEQFDNWDGNRRDLFWRQIYGYVFRFAPACYKQAFCQGLYNLTKKNLPETLARMNTVKNYAYYPGRDVNIHDLDGNPSCRSGFDFAVLSARGACGLAYARTRVIDRSRRWRFEDVFEIYVKQMHQTCRTYAASANTDASDDIVVSIDVNAGLK